MTITEYQKIVKYLRDIIDGTEWSGHCYAVGGCVRDSLRGSDIIKDIDLVVDLRPGCGIEFAQFLHVNGYTIDEPTIASSFGTAAFKLRDFPNEVIEVVQTRSEDYVDRSSRNPVIRFGTLQEDAKRRDFTINCMYLNISDNTLHDGSGCGFYDIKHGIIDCVDDPDIIFSDDPLRMLRCIRFNVRFGYQISVRTWNGIIKNADRLSIITTERIQDEFNKILTAPYAVDGLQSLIDSGLMKYIIPELYDCVGCEQNKYHKDDIWGHTLSVITYTNCNDLKLRMAALLHDIAKPKVMTITDDAVRHFYGHELASADMAESILKRLKYPNNFIKEIKLLVGEHMRTKQLGKTGEKVKTHNVRQIQHLCGNPEIFKRLMDLIYADNVSHADDYCMPLQTMKLLEIDKDLCENNDTGYGYKSPIDGNEVRELLGVEPSPIVGYVMKRLTRYCLSKDILPTADDCRRYVKQNVKYWKSRFNVV